MALSIPSHTKSLSWTHNVTSGREVIRHFHDEEHAGGFGYCLEQPCHAIHQLIDEQPGVKL